MLTSVEDDSRGTSPQMFLVVDVHDNLERLVAREDTDGDRHITIDDKGPRVHIPSRPNTTNV